MRIRGFPAVLVATLAALAVPTGPAAAGGSWLWPDRRAYVPGDRALLRGSFSTGSLEGRISDGPFFAYLLPQGRWIDGSEIPGSAIRLGELRIVHGHGSYPKRAQVEFTVPDVARGFYHVSYCNDPCTVNGIGDLIGSSSFAIAPTRAEGRLMVRVARLESRVRIVAQRVHARTRSERKRLERALEERTSDLGEAETRVAALETQIAALREASGAQAQQARPMVDPWVGVAVAVALAGLAASVLARRRRWPVRHVTIASPPPVHDVPRVLEDAIRRG